MLVLNLVVAMQAQELMCRCCCGVDTSLQQAGDRQRLGHLRPLQHDLLEPIRQSPVVSSSGESSCLFPLQTLHCTRRSFIPIERLPAWEAHQGSVRMQRRALPGRLHPPHALHPPLWLLFFCVSRWEQFLNRKTSPDCLELAVGLYHH